MTRKRKQEIEARLTKMRHAKPRPKRDQFEVVWARSVCILIMLILLILSVRCAPVPVTKQYVIQIDSDIPVEVSVYKSCAGNYNFCGY